MRLSIRVGYREIGLGAANQGALRAGRLGTSQSPHSPLPLAANGAAHQVIFFFPSHCIYAAQLGTFHYSFFRSGGCPRVLLFVRFLPNNPLSISRCCTVALALFCDSHARFVSACWQAGSLPSCAFASRIDCPSITVCVWVQGRGKRASPNRFVSVPRCCGTSIRDFVSARAVLVRGPP